MKRFQKIVGIGAIFTASLLLSLPALAQNQTGSQSTTAPDNSAQNKDRSHTADQQSNKKSDLAITRKIRRSVIADKSLSTYAHNVKIITRHGMVTLKGPVASEEEKQAVVSKAESIVAADKVNNQITVDTSDK
ncbi:MAG: BON domain-containing protein [Acidobacteriaceae bacterium]